MAGLKRRAGSTKTEKDFDPIPNLEPGEYEARLVYVADLGLHTSDYLGEIKPDVQKIALGFEIVGKTITLDGVEVPRQLWMKPINIYDVLTPKGNELIYYKIFEPKAEAEEEADWEAQLGKPCALRIENVKGVGNNEGKVFDNITDVMVIPEKYRGGVAAVTMEMGIGDADDEDNLVTKAMYGLVKYIYGERIKEEVTNNTPTVDDVDYDDDPFAN